MIQVVISGNGSERPVGETEDSQEAFRMARKATGECFPGEWPVIREKPEEVQQ